MSRKPNQPTRQILHFRKSIAFVLIVAACITLLTGCATRTVCIPEARPSEAEKLAGVWIGFDSHELHFVRLDLRPDFTGYCASVSPDDTILHDYGVSAYRVTHWTFDDSKLMLNLTSITTNAEPIFLQGHYTGFSLDMEIGGTNGKWKRGLALYRESRISGANQETRSKISELEKR